MKNIQKYLNLTLLIAFCLSFHISAMEPIGIENTSSESGIAEKDQQALEWRITRLRMINETLNKKLSLSYGGFVDKDRDNTIKQLQKRIQEIIQAAEEMSWGIKPIDIQFISTNLDDIHQKASRF
jgi:hypothetical protein